MPTLAPCLTREWTIGEPLLPDYHPLDLPEEDTLLGATRESETQEHDEQTGDTENRDEAGDNRRK